MNGWIKIYRKMRQWQHYKTPSIRMVFEDLLLSATGSAITYNGVALVAGDAVSSVAILQRNTGLSKPTIIKAIRVLTESGEITRRFENNVAIYHINSFCFYQLQGGKKDLPLSEKGGKTILPQGVKQINHSGKTILPHTRIKEDNKNNIVVDNKARTRMREELIANAKTDIAIEQGCRSLGLTQEGYLELLDAVINDWEYSDVPDNEWTMYHLLNTMRIKNNVKKKENGQQTYITDPVARRYDERKRRISDIAAASAALAAKNSETVERPF